MKKLKLVYPLLAIIFSILWAMPNRASALTNTLISGTAQQGSGISASNDGRYIAFVSTSNSLVTGDTNNVQDAFVRDTVNNTTTRISVSSAGVQGIKYTWKASLSGNGRFALMTSYAKNLASGGSNTDPNVYIRDLQTGTTSLVATDATSEAISEDGRFVYYVSSDFSLQRKDMVTGSTVRVDVSTSGTGTKAVSNAQADSSCDGRYVVFSSGASDLVSSDTNGNNDIFLTDSMGGTIKNLTIASNGYSSLPQISCDGNFVYFYSDATNLVSGDSNGATDLFQYDVTRNTTALISLDTSGNQFGTMFSTNGGFNQTWGGTSASMDGRYVTFSIDKAISSGGTVIVSSMIYLRDTIAGTTTALSPSGSGNFAGNPVITYDGRTVYYTFGTVQFTRDLYSATSYI